MKAVFIVFNQAFTERVFFIFDRLNIRGYTFWENVKGRGSKNGDPHMGTHTWPEMNSAIITIIEEEKVPSLLESVKKLDNVNDEVGVRAFVWDILQIV